MPNPKNYDNQEKWMAACVPTRIEEGDKQDQAVAVCMNMWRNKEIDEAVGFWQQFRGLFAKEKPTKPVDGKKYPSKESSFVVWKDSETGVYRWLAVYSNKWRDEDNPPEILTSQAHKDFVDAVDKGDWPYPEAWLWHVPGTKFGVADYVAYDETGFALASGTVDKDNERIAQFLMEQEDLAMSHGMPVKEIVRDTEDSTIITRYRTMEVSPLPRESAANKYGTAIEFREVKMAIPENKRSFLEEALGSKGLEDLEAKLADKAKELEELEIESKEEEEAQEDEQVAETVLEAEPEEESEESEPKEAEEAPEPVYVTAEEVADAVGRTVKPLFEQITALQQVIEEQSKELKELRKNDDEKLKETLANTPAASLFDRIGSVIGSEETQVDGRTGLAKAGPEETKDYRNGPTQVELLNELFSQAWGK